MGGALVAQALEGLNTWWRQPVNTAISDSANTKTNPTAEGGLSLPSSEAELVRVAAPVLRSTIQGLSPTQLVSCAELCTHNLLQADAMTSQTAALVRDIVQESVRRLSNFTTSD